MVARGACGQGGQWEKSTQAEDTSHIFFSPSVCPEMPEFEPFCRECAQAPNAATDAPTDTKPKEKQKTKKNYKTALLPILPLFASIHQNIPCTERRLTPSSPTRPRAPAPTPRQSSRSTTPRIIFPSLVLLPSVPDTNSYPSLPLCPTTDTSSSSSAFILFSLACILSPPGHSHSSSIPQPRNNIHRLLQSADTPRSSICALDHYHPHLLVPLIQASKKLIASVFASQTLVRALQKVPILHTSTTSQGHFVSPSIVYVHPKYSLSDHSKIPPTLLKHRVSNTSYVK